MIPASLIKGLPPFGRGVYARDTVERYADSFVALNAARNDTAAKAAEARSRGLSVWLYYTPELWRPSIWRASLARIVEQARQLNACGVIVDAEGGWETAAPGDARALGEAMRNAANTTRVGFTSYPLWRFMRVVAQACGGDVWATPQIYGRSANDAATFESWFRPWVANFGAGKVIPSIAGWASSPALGTRAGFAAYLANLPGGAGFIAWDEAGEAPEYIIEELSRYAPPDMVAHVGRALAAQPIVAVTLAASVGVAGFAAYRGL